MRPPLLSSARIAAALLGVALCLVPVDSAGALGNDRGDAVDTAEATLARAVAARRGAESRLADLEGQGGQLRAAQDRLDAGAAEITEELATARRLVREYAVSAYIDGGQNALVQAVLTPTERARYAWRTDIVAGQAASAAEAVDRWVALRRDNDPERLAAAAALDRNRAALQEARSDVLQASALERDAELALEGARRARAEARAAEQAAAAARAAVTTTAAPSRPATAAKPNTPQTVAPAPAKPAAPTAVPKPAPAPVTAPPAPPAPPGSGPTPAEAALLARIRQCESGGNYAAVSSSGRYRGAYQFDMATWASVGGSGDPAAASPAEQDYRALLLLRARGNRAWPNCGR